MGENPPIQVGVFYACDGGQMVAAPTQGSVRPGGSRNPWAKRFKPFGLGWAVAIPAVVEDVQIYCIRSPLAPNVVVRSNDPPPIAMAANASCLINHAFGSMVGAEARSKTRTFQSQLRFNGGITTPRWCAKWGVAVVNFLRHSLPHRISLPYPGFRRAGQILWFHPPKFPQGVGGDPAG